MVLANENGWSKRTRKIGPILETSQRAAIPFKMEVNVSEEMIYAALEELMKNNTESIQSATNYLLMAMNNGNSLILFFSMISKPYPDSVLINSSVEHYARQLCALFCRRMILQFYKEFDSVSKNNRGGRSVHITGSEIDHTRASEAGKERPRPASNLRDGFRDCQLRDGVESVARGHRQHRNRFASSEL